MNKIRVDLLGNIKEFFKGEYLFPIEKDSYERAVKLLRDDYFKQEKSPLKFKDDAFWAYKGFAFQVINGYDAKSDQEISYNIAREYWNIKKLSLTAADYVSLKDFTSEISQILNFRSCGFPITSSMWWYIGMRQVRVHNKDEEEVLKNIRKLVLLEHREMLRNDPDKLAIISKLIEDVDSNPLDSSLLQDFHTFGFDVGGNS